MKDKKDDAPLYGGKAVVCGNSEFRIHILQLVVCLFIACSVIFLQIHQMNLQDDTAPAGRQVLLDVPFICQRDKYPNACESVSAVMALQFYGIDITVEEFVGQYLTIGIAPYIDSDGIRRGCDPWEAFPGNPCDKTGWGCYAPVIAKALKAVPLTDGFQVLEIYDLSVSELCGRYIDNGIPVIFWATIDMQKPEVSLSWNILGTDDEFTWIAPLHCLLLTGYDDMYYYFNDPLQKKNCRYTKDSVELAYAGMYSQAVVLVRQDVTT